ncbi:MAG: cobaltochelatase subunit CobN, partial [Spongiibacteraceae bacterium]|nr:cobaltochelatase subunit CobN [Spongiibacteraceae bacterium]
LVIPALRFGKVLLLPQPSRAWGEDAQKMFHASDLAPHHQYIATYAWLREQAGVDAVIHLGTHGTHEWLDGKDVGLNEEDAPDALIGDLPNLYVYNVDVVGEGLVARRRGMATLIDHMVPPFVTGGLYGDIAKLNEDISRYDANLHKNPDLAEAYADDVRKQIIALGIARDLGLDLDDPDNFDHDTVHLIQDHLIELRSQYIPYGLHTFGRLPATGQIDSTVAAIVSMDRSLIGDTRERLAADMEERIELSAQRELGNLMHALAGGFVGTGSGGEPIRNPDAYPTGKNFYGLDPEKVPTQAAWRLGSELGQQLLDSYHEQHGRYPAKVSFVIWGDETMRHEGIVESQIFYLLGTRPVWNERGQLVDVEVIPRAELGRPRVDIVIASAAEGMFTNLTMMMDRAVQKVKMVDEADNMVRRHYLATRAALIERGYSEEDAERRAGVRIFDEPPGTYNLNTSAIAAASGTWETDAGLAHDYMKKMGHGFGNGFWGEPMEDVFRLALAGTEQIVHSSSTMLYGALDNDDFYMYMGGLAAAVRSVDGTTPELMVTNTRDLGNPEMTTLDKFIGTEFRSRYINPEWIRGMQAEGYAGAVEMQQFVEYLWGWEATVSDVIDERMWQETFEVYVQDKHGLDMDAWFDRHSPYAFQNISARMLETIRKEGWDAAEAVEQELLQAYLDSVEEHGVGCSEVTCGNPRLLQHIIERATELGLSAGQIEQLRSDAERQLGAPIAELAAAMQQFSEHNEQVIREREVPSYAEAAPAAVGSAPSLQGYRMERIGQEATPAAAAGPAAGTQRLAEPDSWQVTGAGAVVLAALWWWRRRYRERSAALLSRA